MYAGAAVNDRARRQERDARGHRLDDADRVTIGALELVVDFKGDEREQGRGHRHQHVGAQARRPILALALQADGRSRGRREQQSRADLELVRDRVARIQRVVPGHRFSLLPSAS
jgi:hypothetical protein